MNDKAFASIDWTLIQSFVAVAECGSLTAAAQRLRASQPTIGRHISQIESSLGVVLFSRVHRGLELTAEGEALLPAARDMKAAAARLSLAAAGQTQNLSGVVRITASVFVSHYILPPLLAELRAMEPDIEIELHASDSTDNLLFHEADIALRMYRPEQLDTITRHICDFDVGIYAAKTYLARRGVPQDRDKLMAHDWVGYDRNDLMIKGMRAVGWTVDRSFFKIRCDNQSAYWQLVQAGCGVGVALKCVAQHCAEVEQILPEVEVPPLPVWLTAPEALRKSPRIRRVFDFLAEKLVDVGGA
ncbi:MULTISPECIES: LysR family transcriptional regulator [Halocynthiibacter]|uniref:LysR family transcriptional regulator n=1 Tax=Halocynthiibacter halioticoli TaxID=2986804 RepID=A0AAE3LSA5_9RHOB|nr:MULTISPECIES: LysR family transcriptional regulator [Halocynthiibacter]MCV6823181.1 LysR family transcriptional regulator [Halocynthiibacter halioticoli]MCW4056182.1 LysR family transcriptional regulator [Halocynthiibacter sp. SDUM655004]